MPPSNPPLPSNSLPPKENSLFKRTLKCYERKQFKNGLKFAKQILSNPKFAEHGETLAIKGLTLNSLGRKEEAYEYVRRGLRNDLKSHICWHFYGLLQRSDKKYDEAIKCYLNALKWEKDNLQILRDLAFLQIQMRDLEGYRDTRYQLFIQRPTQRTSWIGFAMAYHLLKDYDMALKILDSFRKTLVPGSYDYEHSEVLLYHNMVIQESGDLQGALNHLLKCQYEIHDLQSVEETLSDLYLKLGKHKEAEELIAKLLKRNPENTMYYTMLYDALELKTNEEKLNVLTDFVTNNPKTSAPKRLILNFAEGDRFREEADKYLKTGLRKGIPSLFVDVRSLYKDPSKAEIIFQLITKYKENLEKYSAFTSEELPGETNEEKEPPCTILWTYYFMAQHYDHYRDTENALKFINQAIDHTPTLVELFVTKARIYKHAGDVIEAYRWVDEAQALDTADRCINSKCAKYMLRANLIKDAEDICSKFTREGVSAMENLNEMQCMWFQTECALAYQRLENWGESLKKCHEIDRHFSEIFGDQFDFHIYCMRKMTLRSYVGLLRLEDVLRSHSFYQRAAKCAIEVYLKLHDQPIKDQKIEEQIKLDNLAPSELKKLRNKQRKAQKKAELQLAEVCAAAEKRDQHNKSKQAASDQEPDILPQDELIPEKLARVLDPLDQAIKFLQPLQNLAATNIETHLMAFEIYIRRKRPLLMLQSVKRAYETDKEHPLVHEAVIRFCQNLEIWKKERSFSDPVFTVIDKVMEPIVGSKTPQQLNQEYLKGHMNNLSCSLHAARVMCMLDKSKQAEAIAVVTRLDDGLDSRDIKTCASILAAILEGDFGDCNDLAETYRLACHKLFPLALAFITREQRDMREYKGSNDDKRNELNCDEESEVSEYAGTHGDGRDEHSDKHESPPSKCNASSPEIGKHINIDSNKCTDNIQNK